MQEKEKVGNREEKSQSSYLGKSKAFPELSSPLRRVPLPLRL